MIGLTRSAGRSDAAFAVVSQLCATLGTVRVVAGGAVDALNAISGSGPAYFFYVVEQLTQAAHRLGFSADEAAALDEGTFSATAKLLRHTGTTPAELRRQVTSLNGTKQAAVAVLETAGLPAAFDRVVATSMVWLRELGTG